MNPNYTSYGFIYPIQGPLTKLQSKQSTVGSPSSRFTTASAVILKVEK